MKRFLIFLLVGGFSLSAWAGPPRVPSCAQLLTGGTYAHYLFDLWWDTFWCENYPPPPDVVFAKYFGKVKKSKVKIEGFVSVPLGISRDAEIEAAKAREWERRMKPTLARWYAHLGESARVENLHALAVFYDEPHYHAAAGNPYATVHYPVAYPDREPEGWTEALEEVARLHERQIIRIFMTVVETHVEDDALVKALYDSQAARDFLRRHNRKLFLAFVNIAVTHPEYAGLRRDWNVWE